MAFLCIFSRCLLFYSFYWDIITPPEDTFSRFFHCTFLAIIKKLQNEEERDLVGGTMETMKLATKKEEKKLTSVHTFDDGSQDLPVLIPKDKDDE